MISVRHTIRTNLLKDDLAVPENSGVKLWWLGQAGFILSHQGVRIIIDPYLSDSLAIKYKGKEFPHQRMIPSPIAPDEVFGINWVFCTHAHSDHMDPGTLPSLVKNNPDCRFIVPRAEVATALARGIPDDRLILMKGNDAIDLEDGLTVKTLPSAHEELAQDEHGNYRFLGYCLQFGGITIYHSGDSIPYPGLDQHLAGLDVDLALLPVNGRDEFRASRKVPGNFTINESINLCKQASMPILMAHHWGMFEFNTVPEEALKEAALHAGSEVHLIIPEIQGCYELH